MLKITVMFLALLISPVSQAVEFDHQAWDQLLKHHVKPVRQGQATEVDYAAMSRDRASLKAYLNRLSAVSQAAFDLWSPDEQLAFLINAYNAWTVELVLTGYPEVESIKDLGNVFRSPWSKSFIALLGDERSLDDIEHEMIRGSGRYNDPRIHFAVNCASIGCPALRPEAYVGARIDAQLQDQQQLFLADRTRNRLEQQTLKVSSVFKWYREDFEKGWLGIRSLQQFFVQNSGALGLSRDDVEKLKSEKIQIDFLDYDWRLNSLRNQWTARRSPENQ